VYCTPGDARRIEAHTGKRDFTEFAAPHDPVYFDFEGDPNWERFVFRSDNTRRVLKKQAGGNCTFLGEAGCTLPLEVRPLICRIYPYDFNESGLKPTLSNGCPLELLRPGLSLLEELHMTDATDAERWRRQLYQEIREEPHAAQRTEISCESA
jgi:Fe-S-cluster containining protein